MRRLILIAALLVLPFFAACGSADTPDAATTTVTPSLTSMGIVRPIELTLRDLASHRLERDGALVAYLTPAAGTSLVLDDYVGQEVTVVGATKNETRMTVPLFIVSRVTPTTTDAPIEYRTFEDTTFGYRLKYPTLFTATQTTTGVSFTRGRTKVVELSTITNRTEKELSQFLGDHYGYASTDLTPISAAGLPGYQFQNETGSVVYLARGPEVYALAWLDDGGATRARDHRLFLEIVQSFQPVTAAIDAATVTDDTTLLTLAGLGEFCGGTSGIGCASGLTCQTDGSAGAGGACAEVRGAVAKISLTASEVTANDSLTPLTQTELTRGWYYGDRDAKKAQTPDTWVLVDSGTRFAMWRRPEVAPEFSAPTPAATTTTDGLSAPRRAVFAYVKQHINDLAPDAARRGSWEVTQLAFADPSYVYATYRAGEQQRQLLFVYAVVGEKVSLESKAYFKPSATSVWTTVEGLDTAAGKPTTVVDAAGTVTATSVFAGYTSYKNRVFGYTLAYPQGWYWQNAGNARVEFSDTPFPRGSVRITAEAVAGADFAFGETQKEGDMTVVYVALTADKSLKISGDADYAERIGVMAQAYQKP